MQFDKIKALLKEHALTLILSLLLIATSTLAGLQSAKVTEYKRVMDSMYELSYYELVGSMESIDINISKLMVSSSPGDSLKIISSISRQSDFAAASLSSLPVSYPAMMDSMKFLNTLGDYCRALIKKGGEGLMLSEGDYVNLGDFRASCLSLRTSLEGINSQNIRPDDDWQYYQMVEQEVYDPFTIEDNGGIEYPAIIYDGPFSDSLIGVEPLGLNGDIFDESTAKNTAAKALSIPIDYIQLSAEGSKNLDGYTFSAENGDSAFISKQGGKVIWMIKESETRNEELTYDECLEYAHDYLENIGIRDMVDTWSQTYDGQTIISFAYKQGDCIVYPDLVKIKVDMQEGEIVACDALGYWMNHVQRDLSVELISVEDASNTILGIVNILESSLCIIPSGGGNEFICWEFVCEFGDDNYIFYINAINGIQENVYKVVDTMDGALVV